MYFQKKDWGLVAIGTLASSRPLQAVLSVAQPLFAALLSAGTFPALHVLVLLIIGSFLGLACVFALNDALDFELDKKAGKDFSKKQWDIDSVMALHPMVSGFISQTQQWMWIAFTFAATTVILYVLNPWTILLFLLAIILETIYCRLALVSELKAVVAGLLVATGV